MARVTQNAVVVGDGQFFSLSSSVDSVLEFLKRYNALRFVQAVNEQGQKLFLDAEGNQTTEVTDRPYMSNHPRSGYDKYFNRHGFVNPISPETLDPQGVGKLMAKLFEVAFTIIGRGGSEATEMQAILSGLAAYQQLAPEIISKRQKAIQLAEALKALGPSPEGDQIRRMAAEQGIELPEEGQVAVPEADLSDESDELSDDELEAATDPTVVTA